jgi:hypothetical protein
MMPTQEQFVRWCEDYYFDNRLEPGNPCHGDWESCHYPVPKCLGGSNTVLLLKEHHAIQGVLQSEECNHPCIWGWEKSYLEAEILSLWRKWMGVKAIPGIIRWKGLPREETREHKQAGGRAAMAKLSPEEKAEFSRKGALSQTREQKQAGGRAAMAKLSPEEKESRYLAMKKAMTPEKRKQAYEKANQTKLSKDPEFFSNHARRSARVTLAKNPLHFSDMAKKTNSRRVRCLVTGKISTPGGLTRYQTARGIDPSLREEITND